MDVFLGALGAICKIGLDVDTGFSFIRMFVKKKGVNELKKYRRQNYKHGCSLGAAGSRSKTCGFTRNTDECFGEQKKNFKKNRRGIFSDLKKQKTKKKNKKYHSI